MKKESGTVDRRRQVDSPSPQRHLPLVDLLVDTHAELMELAVAPGLKVLHTMLEDDRTGDLRAVLPAPGRSRRVARRDRRQRGGARWGAKCRFVGSGPTAKKSRCQRLTRSPTPIR